MIIYRPLIISFCGSICEIITLAEPIKKICKKIYDLGNEQVYDSQQSKETIDPRYGKSPRELMQYFGSEVCREELWEDIWIDAAIQKIQKLHSEKGIQIFIIDDCRYTNELIKPINDGRFYTCAFQLVCPDNGTTDSKYLKHKSEKGVDLSYVTDVIVSPKSPGAVDLKQKLREHVFPVLMNQFGCEFLNEEDF